jgi:hypothetical protein
MIPTPQGFVVLLICLLLLPRSVMAMLTFALFITIFGAAAALNLPALGGSSIQPSYLALGFLLLRISFSRIGRFNLIMLATGRNFFLLAYSFYGAVSAFILPKLFANAMLVVPMKPTAGMGPLFFSSQNITTAFYLVGTLMAALAATVIAMRDQRAERIVTIAVAIAWAHASFGLLDAVLSELGLRSVMDIFRNGSYAQLSQRYANFNRLAGTFSEASAYASYGFWWFVFLTELWMRGIRRRTTGAAVLALGVALVLSTSSTAYIGLGAYAGILVLRIVFMPHAFSSATIAWILGSVLVGIIGFLALAVFSPAAYSEFSSLLQAMTVGKAQSSSGLERGIWARQGLDAFVVSHGLGIGAGSFRSSSLLTSIIGSLGVFGIVTFAGHWWRVFRPFAFATYRMRQEGIVSVGAAAAWAAAVGILPGFVSAPSPDPGVLFGFFSGLALGWRHVSDTASLPARLPERTLPQRQPNRI